MSWAGKLIGGAFGFLMGGPLGAMFGAAVGHQFDQTGESASPFKPEADSAEQYKAQMAFFTAVFAVMGHVAKADGRVNEAEIAFARQAMDKLQLNGEMRRTAMHLFAEGKRADFPLEQVLRQFRAECAGRFHLLRWFVELLLELALADGLLHAAEERLLLRVCQAVHFSRFEFHALKTLLEAQVRVGHWRQGQESRQSAAAREPTLAECYEVLGVGPGASDESVRHAYRRLMSRHHPDKLAALGLAGDKLQQANEKTHEIRKAWDIIRKARNL